MSINLPAQFFIHDSSFAFNFPPDTPPVPMHFFQHTSVKSCIARSDVSAYKTGIIGFPQDRDYVPPCIWAFCDSACTICAISRWSEGVSFEKASVKAAPERAESSILLEIRTCAGRKESFDYERNLGVVNGEPQGDVDIGVRIQCTGISRPSSRAFCLTRKAVNS